MSSSPIDRLPYRPCVGIALANREGLLFAGQRIDSDYDAWQMPQGGIDPGETPREAALRELCEETGVPPGAVRILAESRDWIPYDLPHDLVPRLWGGRFRGQEQRWFLMRLEGEDDLIDIRTAHPEFSRWRWLSPDRILDCIVPFKRATYSRVLEEFAPWLSADGDRD